MNASLPFNRRPIDPNERDFSRYRQLRKQWAAEVLENECTPEQWTLFKVALRGLGKGLSAAEFLAWVKGSWLATAHPDVRHIALREIVHRCDRIRVDNGLEPLSDPLPGQPDSLPIRVRDFFREQGGGFR